TNAAVGGIFVSGGYNATLQSGSALAGRSAWTGNSGGYITTVANLGPNVNGQTIKLRFRMASDTSVAAVGWRIDGIAVATGPCTSPTPGGGTPSPNPTLTPAGSATPSPTPGATTPTPPETVCD